MSSPIWSLRGFKHEMDEAEQLDVFPPRSFFIKTETLQKKAPCTFIDPDGKRKTKSGGKKIYTSAAVDSPSSYTLGQTLRLLFHTDSSVKATSLFI